MLLALIQEDVVEVGVGIDDDVYQDRKHRMMTASAASLNTPSHRVGEPGKKALTELAVKMA